MGDISQLLIDQAVLEMRAYDRCITLASAMVLELERTLALGFARRSALQSRWQPPESEREVEREQRKEVQNPQSKTMSEHKVDYSPLALLLLISVALMIGALTAKR